MLHTLLHWLTRFRGVDRSARPAPRRGRFTPRLEFLEGRALPSATAIGGSVYQDVNNNGIRDTNEPGIANDVIQLENSSGTVIGQATTDANGSYLFTQDNSVNTAPQSVTQTATLSPTTTNTTSTLTVNQFDSSLGQLQSVGILINGELVSDVKAASLDASPATVTTSTQGTLTIQAPGANLTLQLSNNQSANLAAGDGSMDFSGPSGTDFGQKSNTGSKTVTLNQGTDDLTPFIGGGSVSLTATSQVATTVSGPGNFVSQASAQASGSIQVVYTYTPSNALKPGQYIVHEVQQPAGYLHGLNTDDNANPIPNSTNSFDIPVTLAANGQSLQNNFGELLPASVSGYTYLDVNKNSVKDSNDPPIAGTTIQLFQGSAQVAQTTTASDGSYSFNALQPGSYTIKETPNPAYFDGSAQVGNLGGTAGTDELFVALGSGAAGLNYNFSEVLSNSSVPPVVPPTAPPPSSPPSSPPASSPVVQSPATPPLSKLLFIGGDWWQLA